MFGKKKESSSVRGKSKVIKLGSPGERLASATVELMNQSNVSDLCLAALRAATAITGASGGYVLTLDPQDSGTLLTEASYSPTGEFQFPDLINRQNSVSGKSLDTYRPLIVRAGMQDSSIDEFGFQVRAAIVLPLLNNRNGEDSATEALGALTLVSHNDERAFGETDRQYLEAIAACLSVNLANLRMEQFRRQTIVESLERISIYLEAKDPLTAGHSMRVARVSIEIGKRLGLDSKTLEDLYTGAILMDIGNASIPDAVLKKPGGLTDEEFAVVRMHPLVSFEICETLRLPPRILQMVRNHHERLDGSGYPDRLRSSELPLPLRILCVADAFDAMKCRRPHREGLTHAEALKQLALDAGTKFDPGVVHILREVLDSGELNDVYEVLAA